MNELNRAFLALGSNIEPEKHLPWAVQKLAEYGTVSCKSSVWQSAPAGYTEQPDFLNAAVLLETDKDAFQICHEIVPIIERELKRVRDPLNKNGPRTIDIDLVLFNSDQLQVEHRIIPDPEIDQRVFLAVPLAELSPDYLLPGQNRSLAAIAEELSKHNQSGFVRREDICL